MGIFGRHPTYEQIKEDLDLNRVWRRVNQGGQEACRQEGVEMEGNFITEEEFKLYSAFLGDNGSPDAIMKIVQRGADDTYRIREVPIEDLRRAYPSEEDRFKLLQALYSYRYFQDEQAEYGIAWRHNQDVIKRWGHIHIQFR